MFRKAIAGILFCSMVLTLESLYVDARTLNEVYEEYKNDEQFQMHYISMQWELQ